jgi:SAM-dependent methyltransferase
MTRIAASHPGKLGDALYALPTIRYLSKKYGTKVDFYTSQVGAPLRKLFEYQECINKFVVLDNYVITRTDYGVQPWLMPVPDEYDQIYHLGFRGNPQMNLRDYIAHIAGVTEPVSVEYDLPLKPKVRLNIKDYIIMAPRGQTTFTGWFHEVCRLSGYPVVQIGSVGEFISGGNSIDCTGLDMYDTLALIKNAKAFVGIMSAPLVLANGFPIPKYVFHDGVHWDMRHVLYSENHHYVVPYNGLPHFMLDDIGAKHYLNTYSKAIEAADYDKITETRHIANMTHVLAGVPYLFEHPHRAWEYGIVLNALRANGCKTLLDIGGGGSIFAPAAAWVGMTVTVLEPNGMFQPYVSLQSQRITNGIGFIHSHFEDFNDEVQYDGVTFISVLEHIGNDMEFVSKAADLVKPGGLLAMTFDYHPEGVAMAPGHHARTYNKEKVFQIIDLLKSKGFGFFCGEPSYDTSEFPICIGGPSYAFASLIMRKS